MVFKFGLTNIYFQGNEHSDSGSKKWDTISFDLGGYSNKLVCRISETDIPGLQWENRETADLYIKGTQPDQVQEHAQVIATLLSFALDSHCCLSYMEKVGDELPIRNLPTRGSFIQRNPVIDANNSDALKAFLRMSYSSYNELHETRSLNVVIELFNLAENQQPMELQLATVFILLENLKATYATQENYCNHYGKYYKNQKDKKNGLGFKTILQEMFSSIGMKGETLSGLSSVVMLRNDIIHTALSEKKFNEQYKIYTDCRNLIAEYLLRLLGFKGSFNLFSERGIGKKIIE
ncbi:hypothetical protein [Marinomonas sp. GJ51-6]|uniref:hypothetical protein n=1 Tax=Marinomonas sp. GJ51-6 TaxID=2992802 RepID=UPI002934AD8A|nr:hypothetical protein [Marinomonas sp. GJ51-6]WOD09244.1 hypothetical protein ONZ50_09605 [Marinomonas sp. GJ51-6]